MDLTIRDLDLIPDLGSVSAVTRPSTCRHLLREVVGARGGGGGKSGAPTPSGRAGPGIQACLQVLGQPTENRFGPL